MVLISDDVSRIHWDEMVSEVPNVNYAWYLVLISASFVRIFPATINYEYKSLKEHRWEIN
jgi:hypothetical protein